MAKADPKVRVLIVDDSAIVRKMLADTIAAEPDMEVVGAAGDPVIARDLILREFPGDDRAAPPPSAPPPQAA